MTVAKGGQVLQQKQKEYVSGKKREIQEELKRQKLSFEGNVANNASISGNLGVDSASTYYSRGILQNGAAAGGTGNLSVQLQAGSPLGQGAPTAQTGEGGGGSNMLDKSGADGKKLYVNDYVMNVQKDEGRVTLGSTSATVTKSGSGQVVLSGANTYTGGTVISGGTLRTPAQSFSDANMAYRDGTDRNGGAGGDVRHQMDQIQSEQAQGGFSNRLETEPAQKPSSSSSFSFGMAAAAAPGTPAAEQKLAGNESAKVLNSARANNAVVPVLGDMPKQQEPSELAADMQSQPNAPAQEHAAKMPQSQPPEESKLSGAISLPVDFPTEGRVYHFKKLKANAGLTLVMTHPQSFEHWEWLLAFLIAMAAAKAAFRFADKRRLQAA
jgi:autotransporter-associated beta strand protein